MRIQADYYRQFDADGMREVPAEGYGGWRTGEIELDPGRTALVVMHAWDTGTRERFPGWWRAVEYLPRAAAIGRTVFPPLLEAARSAAFKVFHVVGGGDYYKSLPAYRRTVELVGPPSPPSPGVEADGSLEALRAFRRRNVFVGEHNEADVKTAFGRLDFQPEARPVGDEPVAEDSRQLLAVCRQHGVNHLIYMGYAIDWCLLMSPGGMVDMSRFGAMCSVVRQATTAVENRESARAEWGKEMGLWRVALAFGFVFDADALIRAWRR